MAAVQPLLLFLVVAQGVGGQGGDGEPLVNPGGGGGPRGGELNPYQEGEWIGEGTALLIRDFVSAKEAKELKRSAYRLFKADNGPNWQEAAFNTAFMQGEHAQKLLTQGILDLEDRIANLTGIPLHKDETLLMFTRHKPGALPKGTFVRNVHHDKNFAERRTVTVILYLSSARSDADGGHTILPGLPRIEADSGAAVPAAAGDAGVGEVEPVPYLARAFEGAFLEGKRALSAGTMAGQPGQLWDKTALRLVEQECKLALEGRNNALAVRPKLGTALVIRHVLPDGSPNLRAWHTACHAARGAPRFTAQKFKEPLMGDALEDDSAAPAGSSEEL